MSAPNPFSQRLVKWIGGLAVASFIAGVLFSILAPTEPTRASIDPDTYSKSAVGHRALVELLRGLRLPVVVSRARSGEKTGSESALLLLEPSVDAATEDNLRDMVRAAAGEVVVVLPKWDVRRDGDKPWWIDEADWRGAGPGDAVLAALNVDAKVTASGPGPWRGAPEWPEPEVWPTVARPQVVAGPDVVPLLSRGAGALVAWVPFEGRDLYLVSDPDLLNNAGLHRGRNVDVTLAVLKMASPTGSFIIDETLHGYSTPPSVFRQLFEFPLVLALAQAALVVGLLFWAGMRRFGAPTPVPVGLGRGRSVLIENTATLLNFGGHSAYTLRRYWDDALRDVRAALHCPRELRGEALHGWLDRVGAARGVSTPVADLHDGIRRAARDRATPLERLHAARAVHAWRTQVLAKN